MNYFVQAQQWILASSYLKTNFENSYLEILSQGEHFSKNILGFLLLSAYILRKGKARNINEPILKSIHSG